MGTERQYDDRMMRVASSQNIGPCRMCGGGKFWRLKDTGRGAPGGWTCDNCYPPMPREPYVERRIDRIDDKPTEPVKWQLG